jgi:hypothetical protein
MREAIAVQVVINIIDPSSVLNKDLRREMLWVHSFLWRWVRLRRKELERYRRSSTLYVQVLLPI